MRSTALMVSIVASGLAIATHLVHPSNSATPPYAAAYGVGTDVPESMRPKDPPPPVVVTAPPPVRSYSDNLAGSFNKWIDRSIGDACMQTTLTNDPFLLAMLKVKMRDPDSTVIDNAFAACDRKLEKTNKNTRVVCVEFRSRNGFGGYESGGAVIFLDLLLWSVNKPHQWNHYCAGDHA